MNKVLDNDGHLSIFLAIQDNLYLPIRDCRSLASSSQTFFTSSNSLFSWCLSNRSHSSKMEMGERKTRFHLICTLFWNKSNLNWFLQTFWKELLIHSLIREKDVFWKLYRKVFKVKRVQNNLCRIPPIDFYSKEFQELNVHCGMSTCSKMVWNLGKESKKNGNNHDDIRLFLILFFEPCRIVPGLPKHVFVLVWIVYLLLISSTLDVIAIYYSVGSLRSEQPKSVHNKRT